MPLPSSVTVNSDFAVLPRRRKIDRLARRGKADRVRQKVEENLPDAFAVGDEGADPLHRRDAKGQRRFAEPVLDAFRRRLHGLRDVDVLERQFHRIRVDRGEIENIVDNGEQRRRGFHHIARIFALLVVERADRRIVEKLDEADDIGQRRAQLVGDMMDEIVAQLFGIAQRLVAVAQRLIAFRQGAFDIHAGGRVDEGEQGRAVGKRRRGAIEHGPVAAHETAFEPDALVRQSGDGGAQRAPSFFVGKQRRAKLRHAIDMRPVAEFAWIKRPQVAQRPG